MSFLRSQTADWLLRQAGLLDQHTREMRTLLDQHQADLARWQQVMDQPPQGESSATWFIQQYADRQAIENRYALLFQALRLRHEQEEQTLRQQLQQEQIRQTESLLTIVTW